MRYRRIITYGCIIIMLFTLFQGISFSTPPSTRAVNWDPNLPAKTFEDLFLPHWFENGTYTFDVPEYMHHFKLASTNIWSKYYQYGAEKGRYALINISDNEGIVYWHFDNSNGGNGTPIGGPGRYKGSIKGSKLTIKIIGKSIIQFGIWGSWTENIIDGGKYNITFSGKRIALYMDYYNPTDKHTFYFKSSTPVNAYLFSWDGKLLSYITEPTKEGYVTEPYDASPFLVFERHDGVEGNITVQFWIGYPHENETNYAGVFIVLGVFVAMVTIAYIFSRKSVYGTNKRRKYK